MGVYYQDQQVTLYQGDCTEESGHLNPESVQLSFWSPPYFVGKPYEDGVTEQEWQDMLGAAIHAQARILKPGGFMAVNIADIKCFPDSTLPRFQAEVKERRRSAVTRAMVLETMAAHPGLNRKGIALVLGCSEQTVDRRLNGNNVRGGKAAPQTRIRLVGGMLERFATDAGLYLYDRRIWHKDAAWTNSRWASSTLRSVDEHEDVYIFVKPGPMAVDRSRLEPSEWGEWGSRSVWRIASVRRNDDHPAKFPPELARRVIRLLSVPGDTVIDPFAGSGTTLFAALQLDRKAVGIELDAGYCQTMAERLSGEGKAAA
jgi:site-specific DNA-methyltransferase (adenine-specific)